MKITCIIPTYNEQDNIAKAIESVLSFSDEIIIFDSYSTDVTQEIAAQYNVKFFQRRFDDFSSQKNAAIAKSSNQWIFLLDADERVSKSLQQEIIEVKECPPLSMSFNIYRQYYFLGREINYSGWQTDKVTRLFNRNFCQYDGSLVHEEITTESRQSYLKNKLDHYSFRSFDHHINKLNKYGTLQAKQLLERGVRINIFHFIFKPPVRFLIHYIIRRGFMDGIPGFVLSFMGMYAVFTRYTKLWQLKNQPANYDD